MRSIARIENHPKGPRLYVGGLRIHHGLVGILLGGSGVIGRRRRLGKALIILGAILLGDDAHDFPFSVLDGEAA